MTFLQLQQAVYRRVKLADSPSTTDATRIKQFINLAYRDVLAMPGMDRCRDTTLTFTTVASQKKYGLPQAVSKIRAITDMTNQRNVWPNTLDWLRVNDPGLTASSAVCENYVPLNGWGAELVELTSTGVPLYAVSSSASDTAIKVYVEATRLGGVRAGTIVSGGTTLTGTTRVQLDANTDYIEVVKFYLSAAAVGTVTIYDAAAAGNVLSQITPGRTQARYYMIQLYPTPSAAIALSVDCQRAIEDLVNDTEEPLFHEDYHHGLVHAACAQEWVTRDDVRATAENASAAKIFSYLRYATSVDPDQILVQRGPAGGPQGSSRLGGFYPAGT